MSSLLRLATAGSVDDGKSTLIGRLLYDSKSILQDQLDHVAEASMRRGGNGVLDLSLLTDGLRAEREQGITIDVAYRYFKTPRRTFILADTPGHVQYTRNMVTGASTADVAVILVDARHGVVEQTRRHAFIAALLGIHDMIVAVNKMDLVGFDEARFDEIVRDFSGFQARLGAGVTRVQFVPISALHGDNVVSASEAMSWYGGQPLLSVLEELEPSGDRGTSLPLRFPVQWVIRPGADIDPDYRGYAGQVASGIVQPGDRVKVLPSGIESVVASVETADGPLDEAWAPMSVTIRLEDDIDVSRGDMLVPADSELEPVREFEADVCWFSDQPLRPRTRLIVKHTTASAQALVDELVDVVDVETLARDGGAPAELALNDIGRVRLRVQRPLAVDPYAVNRATGSFILIDSATNDTVGGGMVVSE